MRSNRVLMLGVLFGLLLVAGTAFLFSTRSERQRQLEASGRIQGAIDVMYHFAGRGEPPGEYFLDTIYLVDVDDVSAETMNRIADMLGSGSWSTRDYAARALEFLGPRARKGSRVVPALRRAIAEELAIWKGRRNLIIGAGPTTLDAELRALGKITGVPFEELLEHPEQFERLPPDMGACMEMFNAVECNKLLAEWRAEPY